MGRPSAVRAVVRRLGAAGLIVVVASLLSVAAAQGAGLKPLALAGKAGFHGYQEPLCVSHSSLCADAYANPNGEYVGHDEPSVEFKSSVPGSGNDMTYTVTLPREPSSLPTESGAGATWNFQLRPTFWFGLTLCDTASAPEFTNTCKPNSDANNLVGSNPAAANYIGKHPGNAFMELQFYGNTRRRAAVRGLRLHRDAVLRGDDDRQPDAQPEHGPRELGGLQQLHPRRPRADQLGLYHEEWSLAGAGEPVDAHVSRTPTSARSIPT